MSEVVHAHALGDEALKRLFRQARSHGKWLDKPVSELQLQAIYDLMRQGPTSANCSPARIVFCVCREAKERLRPHLLPSNVEKTMSAPVCAILGYDTNYYELVPRLFPANPKMRDVFAADPDQCRTHGIRNASLQGGYFIMAARALGLDCGPMSGFDHEGVDAAFFPDGRWRTNFLCNIGYGDPSGLKERSPRLDFDEACRIV